MYCGVHGVEQHVQRVNKRDFGRRADSSRDRWHPSNASALGLLPPTITFHRGSYFRSHWATSLRGHRFTGLCLSDDLSADASPVPGLPCPALFSASLQNILGVNVHCRVALSLDILAS